MVIKLILHNEVIKIKLFENFFYNVSYQILNLLLPVITLPYISRVLGVNGIGEYSFTYSNTQYFVLFGMLGITMYGSRTIAQNNVDKEKISKAFLDIYILQLFSCCIAYIIFMTIFGLHNEIYFAQSFFIVSAIFDISWLFIGIEDFKKVVIRNLLVRILGIILIFICVSSSNDLIKYTYIMSLSTLLGQISMWINLNHIIKFYKFKIKEVFRHLRPTLLLFLPQIASSVYLLLDRTMLGVIHGDFEVGVYEQSQKIIRLAVALIVAISGVMMPRIANMIALNKEEEMKKSLLTSSHIIWILAYGITFGILGISDNFVYWFFGEEYLNVIQVLKICSWMIIAISGANLFAILYLIPSNQQNKYTFSVIISAIINIILNLILIPTYSYIGAAISTVVAEFVGVFIQMYFVRKNLELKKFLIPVPKIFLSSIVMYFIIRIIEKYFQANMFSTLIEIVVGGLSYITCLVITKVITKDSLKLLREL